MKDLGVLLAEISLAESEKGLSFTRILCYTCCSYVRKELFYETRKNIKYKKITEHN